MPKVILKIGYDEYLLPDDKGVATVLATLARAVPVRDRTYDGKIKVLKSTVEVSMKIVPGSTRFVADDDDHPLTPEEMGYVRKKPRRLNGQGTLLLEDRRRG